MRGSERINLCGFTMYNQKQKPRLLGSFWSCTKLHQVAPHAKHRAVNILLGPRGWCYSSDGRLDFYWFRSMDPPESIGSP